MIVEWGDRFAEALGGEGLWIWLALGAARAHARRLEARGERAASSLLAAIAAGHSRRRGQDAVALRLSRVIIRALDAASRTT